MILKQVLEDEEIIITEGSIIEIIRRKRPEMLDKSLDNSAMLTKSKGRHILTEIYRAYLDVITESDYPALLLTPTWRANPERVENAGFEFPGFNGLAVDFLQQIAAGYRKENKIAIGGLMGPKNDAYMPAEALSAVEAEKFHRAQALELFNAGVDFILVSTLPAVSEALGIAKALSHSCLGPECARRSCNADISAGLTCSSYILSFVLRPDGKLLDGNSLAQAVDIIDGQNSVPPIGYMAGCTHPDIFIEAMKHTPPEYHKRIIGLQANASACSPEELNNATTLMGDSATKWADAMVKARQEYGIKILGGCCGTDPGYIRELIRRL